MWIKIIPKNISKILKKYIKKVLTIKMKAGIVILVLETRANKQQKLLKKVIDEPG